MSDIIDKALSIAKNNPKVFDKNIAALNEKFKLKYGDPLGNGRHRIGYKVGNYVVKIPRNEDGISVNVKEVLKFQSNKNGNEKYASCELIFDEEYSYIPLVKMEYVDRFDPCVSEYKEKNFWTLSIDMDAKGTQIGKTLDGRIVAFDYQDNP